MPRLLTPKEVADLLGVTTRTLRRYVRAGRLTPVRLGYNVVRYEPIDVSRLIRSATEGNESA